MCSSSCRLTRLHKTELPKDVQGGKEKSKPTMGAECSTSFQRLVALIQGKSSTIVDIDRFSFCKSVFDLHGLQAVEDEMQGNICIKQILQGISNTFECDRRTA